MKICNDHQIPSAQLRRREKKRILKEVVHGQQSSQGACPVWSPSQNVSLVASVFTFYFLLWNAGPCAGAACRCSGWEPLMCMCLEDPTQECTHGPCSQPGSAIRIALSSGWPGDLQSVWRPGLPHLRLSWDLRIRNKPLQASGKPHVSVYSKKQHLCVVVCPLCRVMYAEPWVTGNED